MRLSLTKRFLRTPYARVTAVIIAVMIASAIGVGLAIFKLRDDALEDASRDADNIATILSEQAGHASQSIELVLDEMIEEVNRQHFALASDYNAFMGTQATYQYVMDRLSRLPQADVITITNAKGDIVVTSRGWPTPPVNLSDRDYFQHFKDGADDAIFVSEPVNNKITGTWTVYFVKKLMSSRGEFLGIALVGVRPEFFLRTANVVSSLSGQSLLMLRKDGLILLRYPDPVKRTGMRVRGNSEWYGVIKQGGGSYRTPGYFDSEPSVIAVRPVPKYPLVIDIAVSENHALATWRLRAMQFGGVTLAIELAFAFLLRTLYFQYKRIFESEALLASQSEILRLSNIRFDAALSHMSHGIAMYDRDGRLVIHNRKYEQIWGMTADELKPGTSLRQILEKRVSRGIYVGHSPQAYIDRVNFAKDQRYSETQTLSDGRSILVTFDPMPEGSWVTTHEDVTERQQAAAKIAHLAHHDPLTDLANRSLFISRLETYLASAGDDIVVFLIDLDHFKEVNDNLGHGVGDELLRLVAQRLIESVRAEDVVARLGGDEFAIVRRMDRAGVAGIVTLAERMLNIVQAPYAIDGHDVTVGLSIGITRAQPGEAAEQIMRHADLALYRAKGEGRNRFRLFEPAMEEQVLSRRQLALDLQDALASNALRVHYQPIVDSQTLEVTTMEALLRWPHPSRGMVPPPEFIALAEEAGLIHRLGEWVLRQACRDAVSWPEHIKVAVNVSAIQVSQSALSTTIAQVLSDTQFPARRLKLEITESVLLSDSKRALAALHALRDLGLAIALDDFGTGYSSLSYLKMFPFDEIKIDKSFIDDMAVHRGCAAIVSATTTLARAFDVVTTAEGVETPEQFELLRAAAVGQMQGYFFGKPAPASSWDFSRPIAKTAMS